MRIAVTDFAVHESYFLDPNDISGYSPAEHNSCRIHMIQGNTFHVSESIETITQMVQDAEESNLSIEEQNMKLLYNANDSFWDDNWFCGHGENNGNDPVPNGEPCPICGRMDFHDIAFNAEQQRMIEIEQQHDYDGEL